MSRALVLLLVAAAAASAQSPYGTQYDWESVHLLSWSDQLVLGAQTEFDRVVAADPDGNGEMDLFVRADGFPVCVFAPTTYAAMHESSIGTPARDLAAVDSVGRDLLLVVGDSGLHRFDLDLATMAFEEVPIVGLDPAAWSGVLLLRAYDEPAEGCSYVVGVDLDRVTVRVARYSWASGFQDVAQFTLGAPVIDLVFPRWDGPARDLAFLCNDGLRVVDRLGGVVEPPFPSWHPEGVVATIAREDAVDRDLVAWMTQTPNQQSWYLFVLGQGIVDGPVLANYPTDHGGDPTRVEPVSIAGGDLDGDGDDDLALALRESDFDHLLLNAWHESSGAGRFGAGPGSHLAVEVTPDGSATAADDRGRGLLVDSFEQGTHWYVRPLEGAGGLLVRPAVPFPNGLQPTQLPRLAAHDVFAPPIYVPGPSSGDLRVRLWVPDVLDFEPTHVRVLLWRQPAPAAATYVESPSERHVPFLVARELEILQDDQELSIEIPEVDAFSGDLYLVELRFQAKDGLGVVLRTSESIAAALIVESNDNDVMTLLGELDLDGAPFWFYPIVGSPGTTLVGAFGPLIRIPEFEESAPPRPAPQEPEAQAVTWEED